MPGIQTPLILQHESNEIPPPQPTLSRGGMTQPSSPTTLKEHELFYDRVSTTCCSEGEDESFYCGLLRSGVGNGVLQTCKPQYTRA